MPADLATLRRIPAFSALGPDDLARVAAMTVERTPQRGEIVILEGDRAGALYYVREGLIKIFKTSPEGREQVLRLIGPGNTFNEVPALDGGPNPASAAAMQPSVVYAVGSAELRRLIVERPNIA